MDLWETCCEREMELTQKRPMVGPNINGVQTSVSTTRQKVCQELK
jgi:hypothetical protein